MQDSAKDEPSVSNIDEIISKFALKRGFVYSASASCSRQMRSPKCDLSAAVGKPLTSSVKNDAVSVDVLPNNMEEKPSTVTVVSLPLTSCYEKELSSVTASGIMEDILDIFEVLQQGTSFERETEARERTTCLQVLFAASLAFTNENGNLDLSNKLRSHFVYQLYPELSSACLQTDPLVNLVLSKTAFTLSDMDALKLKKSVLPTGIRQQILHGNVLEARSPTRAIMLQLIDRFFIDSNMTHSALRTSKVETSVYDSIPFHLHKVIERSKSVSTRIFCGCISDDHSRFALGFENSAISIFRTSEPNCNIPKHKNFEPADHVPFDESWTSPLHTPLNSCLDHFVDTLYCANGRVYAMEFSGIDNEYLLAGTEKGAIRLFRLPDSRPVCSYKAHSLPVWTLSRCLYRHAFATGSFDHKVCIFDYERIFPVRIFPGHSNSVDVVAFQATMQCTASTGNLLASASSDRSVRLWDPRLATCVSLCSGLIGTPMAMSWTPCGQYCICSTAGGHLYAWEIRHGSEPVWKTKLPVSIGSLSCGQSLKIDDNDPNCCIACADELGHVKVFDWSLRSNMNDDINEACVYNTGLKIVALDRSLSKGLSAVGYRLNK